MSWGFVYYAAPVAAYRLGGAAATDTEEVTPGIVFDYEGAEQW